MPLVDTALTQAVADALPEALRTDNGYRIELVARHERPGVVHVLSDRCRAGPSPRATVRLTRRRACRSSLPMSVHVYPLRSSQSSPPLALWVRIQRRRHGASGLARPSGLARSFPPGVPRGFSSRHDGVLSLPGPAGVRRQRPAAGEARFSEIGPLDRPLARRTGSTSCTVALAGTGVLRRRRWEPIAFRRRLGAWTQAFAQHAARRGPEARPVPSSGRRRAYPALAEMPRRLPPGTRRSEVRPTGPRCGSPSSPRPYPRLLPADADHLRHALPHMCPRFSSGSRPCSRTCSNTLGPQRRLWLYSAIGPSRTMDPYSYYRLLPWLCYRHRVRGCIFWAFGDVGSRPFLVERLHGRRSPVRAAVLRA